MKMAKYETNMDGYEVACFSPKHKINVRRGTIVSSDENKFTMTRNKTTGYVSCTINNDNVYIHHLVYMQAYGDVPEGLVVNHINENKSDNRLDNLEAVTHSINCQLAAVNRDFSYTCKKGEKNQPKSVIAISHENPFDDSQVFDSVYQCSKALGINVGIISKCCDKKKYCKSGKSKIDGKRYSFEWLE
jgi:hypothetical protein